MSSIVIPINLVNLICEWAPGDDLNWYPFFCVKTHKVSWKVNKYCKKYSEIAEVILKNSCKIEGIINLYNINARITIKKKFEALLFKYNYYTCKLYLQFNLEDNEGSLCRSMTNFYKTIDETDQYSDINHNYKNYIYFNDKNIGLIKDGYCLQNMKKIVLYYEQF
jgi:hypothetical protein